MQSPTETRVTPGMEVGARGERWRVIAAQPHADCTAVRLAGEGRTNAGVRLTLLQPFDRIRSLAVVRRIEFVSHRRWCRSVRRVLAQQRPFGGLDALASAVVDILPYQLEPALSMARHGRLRVLIADDVGLGKTIQAAVVLAQLAFDQPDSRALIVCPAGLRGQWQTELARFGLSSTICDVTWLLDAARELPPAVNPWALPGIHVASVDLVKRPEVLRALEDVTWEATVFDEAHILSPGTARHAAAHALAGRSRRVVLLTATPPDGDARHMSSLVSLGQAPAGDEITVFRRTRADTGPQLPRRSLLLPVHLTLAERRMHRLLGRYTALLWHDAVARSDARTRLLTILLRKRALSSARSLVLTLDRRLSLLAIEPTNAAQLLLPLADEDPLDDEVADAVTGARGLDDPAAERRLLHEIGNAAALAARDESKVRALARFLTRAGESAIVFTEYRDTLEGLLASLPDRRPMQLHGAMTIPEREQVLAEFRSGGGLVLATDAASEGLNLQHHCRLVVHFELPWNPMRLQQRVGRVDRLGQTRRVHEVLLVARDTAERLVLAPLVRRLAAVQRARGGSRLSRLTESDVATMILDGRVVETGEPRDTPAFMSLDLRSEAAHEARRLVSLRGRTNALPGEAARTVVVAGSVRHSTRRATVVLRVASEVRGGPCFGSTVLSLEIELEVPPGADDVTGRLAETLVSAAGRAMLTRVAHEHFQVHGAPWMAWHRVADALVQRETEIRSVVARPSQLLVQAGLFDRRTETAAAERRRVEAALQEDTAARIELLMAQAHVRERVEVVAIHFGDVAG